MNEKISLNKAHLQLIAIAAMVIDHVAWGFVDFWTPLGQFLHVIGRLTIPIMCFFVAEGVKRTRDIRKYFERMAAFYVISVIPFYIFFGEEYGYRQNIIFDHLLSLLVLIVLARTGFKRWQKAVLLVLLFSVSMFIGGWPVTPELFAIAFYYGRSFKEKAKWFVFIDIATVVVVAVLSELNRFLSFSAHDWTWYDRVYLLGFMLALPVLALYNGEKGKIRLGRYFFYAFYPAHFIVLIFIRYMTIGAAELRTVYLWFHIVCLMLVFVMLVSVLQLRASRMQSAVVTFLVLESIYILGFIAEILSTETSTFYMVAGVEYFGELLLLVAFLMYISECGRIRIPLYVYLIHAIAALALVYSIFTSPETGFFYSRITVYEYKGFCKAEYVHSTGYFLSVLFIIAVIVESMVILIRSLVKGTGIEKRRVAMLTAALMFIWIPYAITMTGVTGGLEVPGVGVVGAATFLTLCFYKYGTLDSVAIAKENAFSKAGEGVVILDDRMIVTFTNDIAEKIIGKTGLIHSSALKERTLKSILDGQMSEMGCDDKVYEVRVEELKADSFVQGYTIWFLDATRHRAQLEEAETMANHDALTGLYNRRHFGKLVGEETENRRTGTLVITDMDNFKAVNDTFGHKRGDKVLTDYADILRDFSEEILIPCRIGGDEFMFYLKGMTDRVAVEELVCRIMAEFSRRFRDDEVKCTLSAGIVINDDPDRLMDLGTMYKAADEKLYIAKEKGKNTYVF